MVVVMVVRRSNDKEREREERENMLKIFCKRAPNVNFALIIVIVIIIIIICVDDKDDDDDRHCLTFKLFIIIGLEAF